MVTTATHANAPLMHVRFKGLDPDALYRLKEEDLTLPGSVLMHAGFTLPMLRGDYPSFRLHLERI